VSPGKIKEEKEIIAMHSVPFSLNIYYLLSYLSGMSRENMSPGML
jgi:hypothetical protein